MYREFEENARKASEENGGTGVSAEDSSDTDGEKFTRLYEQMTAYNENIFANHQAELSDPWSYEQSSFDLTEYGMEDNVAAVIEIPRMWNCPYIWEPPGKIWSGERCSWDRLRCL
mgnify:CR=1 FL=1